MLNKVIIFLLLVFLISCQEGLKPENEDIKDIKAYLFGTIIYKESENKFPDSTQCFGVYAAAFKEFPKDSAGIISEILAGNVYMNFSSLPYPDDTTKFQIEIAKPPELLEYIVIAMQTDSASLEAQRAIGVYTDSGDNTKPTTIEVNESDSIYFTIYVDFDNLPPQPFGQ